MLYWMVEWVFKILNKVWKCRNLFFFLLQSPGLEGRHDYISPVKLRNRPRPSTSDVSVQGNSGKCTEYTSIHNETEKLKVHIWIESRIGSYTLPKSILWEVWINSIVTIYIDYYMAVFISHSILARGRCISTQEQLGSRADI